MRRTLSIIFGPFADKGGVFYKSRASRCIQRSVEYTARIIYTDRVDALQRAIALAGSQAELAYMLGVVPMAVTNWRRRGVPPAGAGDRERCCEAPSRASSYGRPCSAGGNAARSRMTHAQCQVCGANSSSAGTAAPEGAPATTGARTARRQGIRQGLGSVRFAPVTPAVRLVFRLRSGARTKRVGSRGQVPDAASRSMTAGRPIGNTTVLMRFVRLISCGSSSSKPRPAMRPLHHHSSTSSARPTPRRLARHKNVSAKSASATIANATTVSSTTRSGSLLHNPRPTSRAEPSSPTLWICCAACTTLPKRPALPRRSARALRQQSSRARYPHAETQTEDLWHLSDPRRRGHFLYHLLLPRHPTQTAISSSLSCSPSKASLLSLSSLAEGAE